MLRLVAASRFPPPQKMAAAASQETDDGIVIAVSVAEDPSSSSSSPPIDDASGVNKLCQVCGEVILKYKGLHYGGLTCYSCRAFFRRCHSAERKEPFVPPNCKNEGTCEVSVKSRRKCAKCRYDLCLKAGMNPTMVLSKEEKEQRFRKYFEKKALLKEQRDDEPMTSPGATDNNSSVIAASKSARPRTVSLNVESNGNASSPVRKRRKKNASHSSAPAAVVASAPQIPSVVTAAITPNNAAADDDDSSPVQVKEQVIEDPKTMSDSRLLELCLSEVDKILADCEQPLPKLTLSTTCVTATVPKTVIVQPATAIAIASPQGPPTAAQAAAILGQQQQPPQQQQQTLQLRPRSPQVIPARLNLNGGTAEFVSNGTNANVLVASQQSPPTPAPATYVTLQPADQNYWSSLHPPSVASTTVTLGYGGHRTTVSGPSGEKYTLERL